MKKILFFSVAFFSTVYANAQFNILGSAQNGAANAANNNASNAGSNAVNNSVNGLFGSKKSAPQQNNTQQANPPASSPANGQSSPSNSSSTNGSAPATPAPQSSPQDNYKAYSNYDFVPGDTIIFADDFSDDQDGEFPSHWNLDAGQSILNKVGSSEAFCITEGNYAFVSPRMKNQSYLTKAFTIEFNFYANNSYGLIIRFHEANGSDGDVHFGDAGGVNTSYFTKDFGGSFPDNTVSFKNNWHHAAFIFKNGTIKCYVDQYRVLVMPNLSDFVPQSLKLGGIGGQDNPIVFKDVRIASGGNMNSIAQKFTDSKIVTHGINFDVDKATIKPESMGTLNMIVKVMQNNPDLKFEIDGHTDNSGASPHNMVLSQQRADAVEAQLISMGIDASRLTTKGFGDTKPISSNDTQDGKANNRRVEFVRM